MDTVTPAVLITPRVSIAMPVFNCESTLALAIESILNQDFPNFEFIICDDGSTDGTLGLAKRYASADARIQLLSNGTNLGLNRSLNRCLEISRGAYFARMDGDDACSRKRIGKLVAFLDKHQEFALVSSWMSTFDQQGTWGIVRTKPRPAAGDFLSGSPFCHAPCMIRTEVLRELNGYGTAGHLRRCEDYDLWFRLYSMGYKGANIQEPLYSMRDDRNARKRRTFSSRIDEARVRLNGYRMLKMPLIRQFYAAVPILIGLLPGPIYDVLHRWKLRR